MTKGTMPDTIGSHLSYQDGMWVGQIAVAGETRFQQQDQGKLQHQISMQVYII